MENFYNKVIFDITQLIINKNYKRAVTLGQFLIGKGFRATELIVVLSYARRVLDGPKEAIEFLQQHLRAQQNQQQHLSESQKIHSPLVQLALSEYSIECQKRDLAQKNLSNLLKVTGQFETSTNNEDNRILVLIRELNKNYKNENNANIFFKNQHENEQQDHSKRVQSQVKQLIQQINYVTQSYTVQKDQLLFGSKQQGGIIQKNDIALKYGQYYIQYDDIKRRILTVLSEHIKKESVNNAMGKRIKRKQHKFLKDTSQDKIKSSLNKQRLVKQAKQQTSFQQIPFQQGTNKLVLEQQKSQAQLQPIILQTNEIQQLQNLLVHVNEFITYFKSKLKDCSTSRARQFMLEDAQTQGGENKLQ